VTAPLNDYSALGGKTLALVENMLHEPFLLGIRQARALGLQVWLLTGDRDWYTHGHDWDSDPVSEVDRVIDVDTTDVDAVCAVLTGPAGELLVDGVSSYSDYHTEVAATVARRLGLPGADPASLSAANNKHELRDAIAGRPYSVGHRLVGSWDATEQAAAELGFPLIAKPPAEAISHGVERVDDVAALHAAYRRLSGMTRSLRGQPRTGEVLLEQYVEGPEVSVETMTVDGVTTVFGVTSKDLFGYPAYLECGHTFPVPLPDGQRAALYAAVVETLAAIGYDRGPCHTEVRLTEAGPRIIEANPRTPSSCMTMLVTDVTGHSPILDGWLLALGLDIDRRPVEHHGGAAVRMVYPPEAGRLIEVGGVERAAAEPGVRVILHVRPGDLLWEHNDNSSCVGFCYSAGTDRLAARDAADRAAAQLRFPVAAAEVVS
jgi:biotin carboxylase